VVAGLQPLLLPLLTRPLLFPASIGPNLKPTYPEKPDPEEDLCEAATASVCTTTLSYGIVVAKRGIETPAPRVPFAEFRHKRRADKRAVTTTTSTIAFCTTVTGCGATDITSTTNSATEATSTCRVVIPRDPHNVDALRNTLQQQLPGTAGFYESRSDQLGTAFFFVPSFTDAETDAIRNHPLVADAYVPRGDLTLSYWGPMPNPAIEAGPSFAAADQAWDHENGTWPPIKERSTLAKRSEIVQADVPNDMAIFSWPPGTGYVTERGDYRFDSSAGEGTYFYHGDYGIDPDHPEFSELLSITPLFLQPFAASGWMENDEKRHGTSCISRAAGKKLGIARKARVVATVFDATTFVFEHWLDALVKIHADIYIKGRGTKSVVNLSVSILESLIPDAFQDRMGMWSFFPFFFSQLPTD